ncbi:MAG: ABC transporter ATP-binding protein [Sulfolobaceae archaeon]
MSNLKLYSMIKVRELTKVYNNKVIAIDNVTFDVNNGEIVGFIGLNGAGKTTTIKIIAGVLLPTRGTVEVDGFDVVKEKVQASKRIGWVPEIPNFDPEAKAIDYLLYIAGFYGLKGDEARKVAKELLVEVGLEGSENKKLKQYSQGMKKRFALAASMISNPDNFLFDEVLNGLDAEGIAFFRKKAQELKSNGKAILFSSHILSEVEGLADKVVIIHKGRIRRVLSRDEIASSGKLIVKLVVDNSDGKLIEFLKNYGEVELQGKYILIRDVKIDPTEISSQLVKMNYRIREFTYEKESLERLFFEIIGENR